MCAASRARLDLDFSFAATFGGELFRRQQTLRPAQIDRHQPADAAFDHRHAEQAVHAAHRHRIVRDDQIARRGFLGHAVALIFGLFLTNPAPICVLDEVDAPLDDANIERFCDLLDRMTEETATRYLIVTHNAATMSRMHRLFGVTMVERGVSRLVSVDLGGAETLLAAE